MSSNEASSRPKSSTSTNHESSTVARQSSSNAPPPITASKLVRVEPPWANNLSRLRPSDWACPWTKWGGTPPRHASPFRDPYYGNDPAYQLRRVEDTGTASTSRFDDRDQTSKSSQHPSQGTPSAPTTKRRRLEPREVVLVLVGGKAEEFLLLKARALETSTYIRSALDGESKDAKESIVRLPEVDVKDFGVFAEWLRTGEIVLDSEDPKKVDRGGKHVGLAKLYKLGADLGSVQLQNATIDNFIATEDKVKGVPNELAIVQAFEFTSKHSTLQNLLVDMFQHCEDVEWLDRKGSELPHGFMLAVFRGRRLLQGKQPPTLNYSNRCKDHEHNGEVPKAASSTD